MGMGVLVLVISGYVQCLQNVPTVLLLMEDIAGLAVKEGYTSTRGYIFVAFICCIAGNLTINGSITQVNMWPQYVAARLKGGGKRAYAPKYHSTSAIHVATTYTQDISQQSTTTDCPPLLNRVHI